MQDKNNRRISIYPLILQYSICWIRYEQRNSVFSFYYSIKDEKKNTEGLFLDKRWSKLMTDWQLNLKIKRKEKKTWYENRNNCDCIETKRKTETRVKILLRKILNVNVHTNSNSESVDKFYFGAQET